MYTYVSLIQVAVSLIHSSLFDSSRFDSSRQPSIRILAQLVHFWRAAYVLRTGAGVSVRGPGGMATALSGHVDLQTTPTQSRGRATHFS